MRTIQISPILSIKIAGIVACAIISSLILWLAFNDYKMQKQQQLRLNISHQKSIYGLQKTIATINQIKENPNAYITNFGWHNILEKLRKKHNILLQNSISETMSPQQITHYLELNGTLNGVLRFTGNLLQIKPNLVLENFSINKNAELLLNYNLQINENKH